MTTLTEFIEKHDISEHDTPLEGLALVGKSDLEQYLKELLSEIEKQKMGASYLVSIYNVRGCFRNCGVDFEEDKQMPSIFQG